jgi:hypothetical protein
MQGLQTARLDIRMPVTLNHTIVHAADPVKTAAFYADMLNLPPARQLGHFTVLQVGDTSLDMLQTDETIAIGHYAFLVSEAEFEDVLDRIKKRKLLYWADPFHKVANEINVGTTAAASTSTIRTAMCSK